MARTRKATQAESEQYKTATRPAYEVLRQPGINTESKEWREAAAVIDGLTTGAGKFRLRPTGLRVVI